MIILENWEKICQFNPLFFHCIGLACGISNNTKYYNNGLEFRIYTNWRIIENTKSIPHTLKRIYNKAKNNNFEKNPQFAAKVLSDWPFAGKYYTKYMQ